LGGSSLKTAWAKKQKNKNKTKQNKKTPKVCKTSFQSITGHGEACLSSQPGQKARPYLKNKQSKKSLLKW
jgi:hypothetical protein